VNDDGDASRTVGGILGRATAEALARRNYDQMAEVYSNHVAQELTVPSLVRSNLEFFAHQVQASGSGLVADVGCGPGHITAFLASLGLDIFGVDISADLIKIARASHPDIRFEIGELAALPAETNSLDGLVARHSLIHTPVHLVPGTIAEFARVLAPGGRLFLSFFATEDPTSHGHPFDHAVSTAYQFAVREVANALASVGLRELARVVRQPGEQERQLPHAILLAQLTQELQPG